MSWNNQKVEDLKKLWNEGVATSQIGVQLGFTKNAVIGKLLDWALKDAKTPEKNQLKANNFLQSPCTGKPVIHLRKVQ